MDGTGSGITFQTKQEFANWLDETIEELERQQASDYTLDEFQTAYADARQNALYWGLVDVLDLLGPLPLDYAAPSSDAARAGVQEIVIARLSRAADWFDPKPPSTLRGRSLEIWWAVANAGRRLTTEEIYQADIEENSHTKGCLARMSLSGILPNRPDKAPPGYGLPQWD